MIIKDSAVTASSKGSYQKMTLENTSLTVSKGVSSANGSLSQSYMLATRKENYDSFDYSETNTSKSVSDRDLDAKRDWLINSASSPFKNAPATIYDLKAELINKLMESITGKKFDVGSPKDALKNESGKNGNPNKLKIANSPFSRMNPFKPMMRAMAQGVSQSMEISFVREYAEVESQSVSYNAAATVKTADGKEINVNIGMYMSQTTATYMQESMGVSMTVGKTYVDPLVINYAGSAASLSGEKFEFDLDCDGIKDNISFAGQGSGFLALDKNGDGVINDGSELFGPQSGNGFDELRKYDSDGNGWIDEADDVYSQLKIWSKDKDGNDVLYTLKEADVGAIYLNESKTEYGMYDSGGNMQGNMRSTSFYLKDSGGAGFVSHIDMLV